MNVDTSFVEGFVGLGVIFRNSSAKIVHLQVEYRVAESAFHVELLAIFLGVQAAVEMQIGNIILKFDCLMATVQAAMDMQIGDIILEFNSLMAISMLRWNDFSFFKNELNVLHDIKTRALSFRNIEFS